VATQEASATDTPEVAWYALPPAESARLIGVDPARGLTAEEVASST
jgi:hypothetical protein